MHDNMTVIREDSLLHEDVTQVDVVQQENSMSTEEVTIVPPSAVIDQLMGNDEYVATKKTASPSPEKIKPKPSRAEKRQARLAQQAARKQTTREKNVCEENGLGLGDGASTAAVVLDEAREVKRFAQKEKARLRKQEAMEGAQMALQGLLETEENSGIAEDVQIRVVAGPFEMRGENLQNTILCSSRRKKYVPKRLEREEMNVVEVRSTLSLRLPTTTSSSRSEDFLRCVDENKEVDDTSSHGKKDIINHLDAITSTGTTSILNAGKKKSRPDERKDNVKKIRRVLRFALWHYPPKEAMEALCKIGGIDSVISILPAEEDKDLDEEDEDRTSSAKNADIDNIDMSKSERSSTARPLDVLKKRRPAVRDEDLNVPDDEEEELEEVMMPDNFGSKSHLYQEGAAHMRGICEAHGLRFAHVPLARAKPNLLREKKTWKKVAKYGLEPVQKWLRIVSEDEFLTQKQITEAERGTIIEDDYNTAVPPTILIHCKAGQHRTGFLGYALLRTVMGLNPRQAMEAIGLSRPYTANTCGAERLLIANQMTAWWLSKHHNSARDETSELSE